MYHIHLYLAFKQFINKGFLVHSAVVMVADYLKSMCFMYVIVCSMSPSQTYHCTFFITYIL